MRTKPKYTKQWLNIFYAKKVLSEAVKETENVFRMAEKFSLSAAKILEACRYYGIYEVKPTKNHLTNRHFKDRESLVEISRSYHCSPSAMKAVFRHYRLTPHANTKRVIKKKIDICLLKALYIDQRMGVRGIAKSLGVTELMVSDSMKYHGINDRYGSAWLYARYWKDRKSLQELADESEMSVGAIVKRMRSHGIPTRSINFPTTVKQRPVVVKHCLTKEQIKAAIDKGKYLSRASKIVGCSSDTFKAHAKKFGIYVPKRLEVTVEDAAYKYPQLRDSLWMYTQYNVLGKKPQTISNEMGCTLSAVQKALRTLGLLAIKRSQESDRFAVTAQGQKTIKIKPTELKQYQLYT